jgi:hypothetical protein
MVIKNEEIMELLLDVPEGHRHLRARFALADGSEIVLQEATVANLVRAYVTIKTHPSTNGLRLKGTRLEERKEGYAEWQLIETA